MRPDLVSIMMPAYNAAPYIARAIESVLAQSYPHWELIIVDDGSTDETYQIAAAFDDPRIYLHRQSNCGEAAARNRALSIMRGHFIAFLDADDLFQPDHLNATVSFLQQYWNYEGVYTDGHYCDQGGNLGPRLSSRRRGPFDQWIFEELVRASDVFGPPICVVLRHATVLQHQLGFDPLIVIGPDWDFLTRCAEVARFGYIDQTTCLYRVHQTNVTLRVDLQKRADSLARCREKAIKLPKFAACTLETRIAAFYDLLINLLRGNAPQQDVISYWPEFTALPANDQARLLRLMASKNMVHRHSQAADEQFYVERWLARSRALNPRCVRVQLLAAAYKASPTLCRQVVHAKQLLRPDTSDESPFGKLV